MNIEEHLSDVANISDTFEDLAQVAICTTEISGEDITSGAVIEGLLGDGFELLRVPLKSGEYALALKTEDGMGILITPDEAPLNFGENDSYDVVQITPIAWKDMAIAASDATLRSLAEDFADKMADVLESSPPAS